MKLTLRSHVEAMWGTPAWNHFIADIAVEKLDLAPAGGRLEPAGWDERVDPSNG